MGTVNEFVEHFHKLSDDGKKSFINSLTVTQKEALYQYPELFLFPKQIIYDGDYRYYILLCGRGFGKTFAGSGWIYRKVLDGAMSLACCAPTYSDLYGVMIPAIQAWSPPGKKPVYNQKEHTLIYPNGATIWCFSSDTEVRGPNIEYMWCDEIAKWCDSIPEKVEERFDVLDFAVRVGDNPQTIITTSPKPFPLIKKWIENSTKTHRYRIQTGTLFDNPHISKKAKDDLLFKYDGTRLGRQELWGELLEDVEGALWSTKLIDDNRITLSDFKEKVKIERTVIAVDPAVTDSKDSDSTGISVVGISKNQAYVIADCTIKGSPNAWARAAIDAYTKYGASMVIAEQNQGGDLVTMNLRTIANNLPIKLIHAKKSKLVRAEPVAALYEQGKIHHVGIFHELEKEMTTYNANPKCKSPDRMDALVYAITELMLNNIYTNRDFSNIGSY